MYGLTVLFGRHTWQDLHTWVGLLMMAIAVLHFAIHWPWVKVITKRTLQARIVSGDTAEVVSSATASLDQPLTTGSITPAQTNNRAQR